MPVPADRPNVLMVVFDTARADAVEPYGAPSGATPTVRQLASSGVALSGRSTACWTLPSHMSFFSGLLPRGTGLPPGPAPKRARPAVTAQQPRWLPVVLRKAGWRTIGISTNAWVSPPTGFDQGFESFDWLRSARAYGFPKTRSERWRWDLAAIAAKRDDGAEEARRRLVQRLEQLDRSQPFFAFVNLVECHSPYLPPKPWNDLPAWRRLRASASARRHQTYGAFARACLMGSQVPDGDLAVMRHLYSRAVSSMDAWLAQVLEELDRRDLADDTVVVILSDHGENFGEGGLLNHMFSLDDRLLSVPLVLSGPGVTPPHDGAASVSLADLPATLARLVGLTEHPWASGAAGRDGTTVAQFIAPAGPDEPGALDVKRMWDLDDAGFARLTTSFSCATDGQIKLIRRANGGGELSIDLEADPLELDPRPASAANGSLDRLRSALDRAEAAERAPITEAVDAPVLGDQERAQLEQQMRLLGYI